MREHGYQKQIVRVLSLYDELTLPFFLCFLMFQLVLEEY